MAICFFTVCNLQYLIETFNYSSGVHFVWGFFWVLLFFVLWWFFFPPGIILQKSLKKSLNLWRGLAFFLVHARIGRISDVVSLLTPESTVIVSELAFKCKGYHDFKMKKKPLDWWCKVSLGLLFTLGTCRTEGADCITGRDPDLLAELDGI